MMILIIGPCQAQIHDASSDSALPNVSDTLDSPYCGARIMVCVVPFLIWGITDICHQMCGTP
mgnify:CR=1 FL=1